VSGDRIIRAVTAATVIGLAVVAAVISYRHAYAVAIAHGEVGATAILTPVTIDGLVLVAGLVMLDSARRRRRPPVLAWVALVLGVSATVAVNVLHGLENGPIGAAVAAWPAGAFVLAVELLMGMIRRVGTAEGRPVTAVATTETDDPDPKLAEAREKFGDLLEAGKLPSVRAIRRGLRVGHPRAREILSTLAESTSGPQGKAPATSKNAPSYLLS